MGNFGDGFDTKFSRASSGFQPPTGKLSVLALYCLTHIVGSDTKGAQAFIVEPDAHGAFTTSHQIHSAHTIEALKTFLGDIVCKGRQLSNRYIACNHNGNDRCRIRVDLVHDWRVHIRWQLCQGKLHLVSHILNFFAGVRT